MKLTQKTWFIILMLFVFFPVGLYFMWRSGWNKIVKIIVSVFFVIMIVSAFGNGENNNSQENDNTISVDVANKKEPKNEEMAKEPEQKEAVVPEKTPEEIEGEFKTTCEEFDYKDVARNPENYKNKNAIINGKVIQVSEGLLGSVTLRVATKESEYLGYTDDVYLVTYKQVESNRILEDDMITIWGVCDGVTTYSSVLGGKITVPSVKMEYYEIH